MISFFAGSKFCPDMKGIDMIAKAAENTIFFIKYIKSYLFCKSGKYFDTSTP